MGVWLEEAVEDPIRPLVKLLRDNGFNTFCSCGHEMYVELEWYEDGYVTRLYNLLVEAGYSEWRIVAKTELVRGMYTRSLQITLPKKES